MTNQHDRGKVEAVGTFSCLQINEILNKNNSFNVSEIFPFDLKEKKWCVEQS